MTTQDEHVSAAVAMKRAFVTIERLQRQLAEHERARSEPIAITGMACRFPGGVVDPESYWHLLSTGRDAITEVPASRWDVDAYYDKDPQQPGKISSRWGGFLDGVDRFDHEFFGISRREAVYMDPQQRLILELGWHALEDAGQAPDRLAGSRTGVFVGICNTDYAGQVFRFPDRITAYATSGNAHSIAAGRLSYLLDLRGPNVAIDTACSSSLVAVHQACQSLRLGESDLAIGGAVNVLLSPQASIALSQLNESFAADGRIKAFDAAADGFVRSEGCGMVVLKRLSDAERDGDRVYAVIRGSVVNQDGRSAGLTAPNGAAQRAMLRAALQVSGVDADQIGFVETHGTGTRLGDPIEVDALAEVFGRADGPPVYLGAVKTNLGHLEAAAGMAGLIKAALSVERGLIPPNLHFRALSPHLSFDGTALAVPTELTPWPPAGAGPRRAGVSSFGLSGTNAHVVLEQAPEVVAIERDAQRPLSILALSARSEAALAKVARRYRDVLAAGAADVSDVCYSGNTGRSHMRHRLAVTGRSASEMATRLDDFVRGEDAERLTVDRVTGTTGSDVVFLFSGAGPQRPGMSRELYETQPTFRRVVDRCDDILRGSLETPLLTALFPDDPGSNLIYDVEYAVPGLFAVEYALAELWRSWGVEPTAVMGHSLGEYAAACFAGVMSLEDGLRLVARRARLLQEFALPGAMAAVFATHQAVAEALTAYDPADVAVAAVNGPTNTTISGTAEAVAAVTTAFAARGVEVKALHVPRSGHSPLVEPVLEPLRAELGTMSFAPPRIPLVSNVTGRLWQWDQAPDADYWCRHTRQPVLFARGVETLCDLGYRTFVEIGPATNLLGMAAEIVPSGSDALLLPSLRPAQSDLDVILDSLSRLYARGATVDWAGFDRDYTRTRVRLPGYPFDPVRCWHDLGSDPLPSAPDGRQTGNGQHPDDGPDRLAHAQSSLARGVNRGPRGGRASVLPTAEELLGVPADRRLDVLVPKLVETARQALGSRSTDVDPDEPLAGLGLDSLMAVELRNDIQSRLKVSMTVANFLSGATIRSVAADVVAQLAADATGTGPDAEPVIRRVDRAEDVAARLLDSLDASPADSGQSVSIGEDGRD